MLNAATADSETRILQDGYTVAEKCTRLTVEGKAKRPWPGEVCQREAIL